MMSLTCILCQTVLMSNRQNSCLPPLTLVIALVPMGVEARLSKIILSQRTPKVELHFSLRTHHPVLLLIILNPENSGMLMGMNALQGKDAVTGNCRGVLKQTGNVTHFMHGFLCHSVISSYWRLLNTVDRGVFILSRDMLLIT